jgi:hypothetical protein
MKFQSSGGLEGSLIEDDTGASIGRLKRQGDQRLLVVGVRFFIDEREDEAVWCLDRTKGATDVEDISIRRLDDDPVIRSFHRIELKVRKRESSGTPPASKLLGVDERGKDPLRGLKEDISR